MLESPSLWHSLLRILCHYRCNANFSSSVGCFFFRWYRKERVDRSAFPRERPSLSDLPSRPAEMYVP